MRLTANGLAGPVTNRPARVPCFETGYRPGACFLRHATLALCATLFAGATGWAQPVDDGDGISVTCDDYNVYGNAYFGDTHVHTTYSVDAYTQGTDTTPDQAYRFAEGELIGFQPFDEQGNPTRYAQIGRPLDFAIVTDHAELFGERSICLDDNNPLYNEPDCVTLRERTGTALVEWNSLLGAQQGSVARFDWCGADGSICTSALQGTWQEMQDVAAAHYTAGQPVAAGEPPDCSFTTFIGYEWTGAPVKITQGVIETLNLHRNVVFRNSIVPARPFTYLDDGYPEHLWAALQQDCIDHVDPQGSCDVFTIPHNSNLSQGKIFDLIGPGGVPYNAAGARTRQKFEPLIEIMQHKGQSECLATSPDELCGFEALQWGHLAANFLEPTTPKVEGTVRYALKKGLASVLGYNPFMYGLIGSTDTHIGAPGHVEEAATFLGHGGAGGGLDTAVFAGITDAPELNPGGLAVVWAPQNSRGALFDAMKRREVYGTSGPRHIVRFWGSWDLPGGICTDPNMTQVAYNNAVPMGSLLPAAGAGQTVPQFLVFAQKDPLGNNLQRIQIIKGWKDAQGDTHEQVFDVAGDPNNGADVDLATCGPTGPPGSEGFAELCQLWQDPAFDAGQKSFYYARVVENPSCRWTHRQCLAADPPIDCSDPASVPAEYASCCDAAVPKTVQERSWASPIWYKPPPAGC
jgi:hypothetical protein